MKIERLKENWQKFGELDPLWAVLSWPEKKGNKWGTEEFFKTGQDEIDAVLNSLKKQKIFFDNEMALDFGCGVGRLTQALAKYFHKVVGVDIAKAMIEQAKKLNTRENCSYILNTATDLKNFPDNHFSFIYSRLTFQHMSPKLTKKYLQEFIRILKSGGVVVFVQPYKKVLFRDSLQKVTVKDALKMALPVWLQNFTRNMNGRLFNHPVMGLYSVDKRTMSDWLKGESIKIINIDEFGDLGGAWICHRYIIKKSAHT